MQVLLAQHQDMLLDGLRSYLVRIDPEVTAVTARSWADALERSSDNTHYDLIVIDLELPGLRGLAEVIERRRTFGDVPLAVLARGATRQDVFWALESGVSAYLTKDMRGPVVLGALTLAMYGERFVPSGILLGEGEIGVGTPERGNHPLDTMTQRQGQVLNLVAAGKTNAEIAGELHVAEPTVRLHLRQIYRKLGVRNRIEAMRVALRLEPPVLRT
jgi:two-component system nitrate/nitrite response regulator NarL